MDRLLESLKKPPSLGKRTDRDTGSAKGLNDADFLSAGSQRACPYVEQLEDRLLYSGDPFGVLIDLPEATADFPVAGAFLPDNHLALAVAANAGADATLDAVADSRANSTARQPTQDTLAHDDIANYLDPADLNLFADAVSAEPEDNGATISSNTVEDKSAQQYTGRRTIMTGGVNDPPTMSGFTVADSVFTETGTAVLIGPSLLVNDPDLDLNNYNGFEIILHRSGGANVADLFDLGSYASGADLVYGGGGGTVIGTILQNSGGTLHLQFNASADTDAVTDTVRAIAYENSAINNAASQVDLLWTLDDNNDGAQGSGGALIANYVSGIDIVPSQFIAVDDDLGDAISGVPLSILPSTLLANETGISANTATIIDNTQPSQGGLTNNGSSLEYSSTAGDSGAVNFDYTAMSGDQNLISQWQLQADATDDTGANTGLVFSDSAANNLVFDGDDHVELPVIDFPPVFTLSFDFKVNDLDTNNEESIFSVGDWESKNSLLIWINGNNYTDPPSQAGMLMTNIWDSDDNKDGYDGYMTDIGPYDDGLWHNYAVVVREGTNPANSGTLIYIDGVAQDTSSHLRGSDPFEPTVAPHIGVDNNSDDGLEYYLTNHEVANFQLLEGYDETELEKDRLNVLNEFSTATVSFDLRNEEELVNNEPLVVAEDLAEPLSPAELWTRDIENTPSELIYSIMNTADLGTLMLNNADMGLGDSFTQDDIDNGRVQYRHGGSETATADSIVLRVDDGAGTFTDLTFQIELTSVNDFPVVGSIEGAALLYSEGDGNVSITNTVVVSDVDNTNLSSAVVAISAGYNASEDILAFSDTANISGSFNSATGILALNGIASKADWQTALRSVSYRNTSDQPDLTDRTVSFVINDGADDSLVALRSIELSAVNDRPTLNDGVLASIVKNTITPAGDTVSNIFSGQFSDVDGTFAGIGIINDATTVEGSWQYSTDAGINWYDIQPLGTATGLAVDVSALLRFLPASDYTGAVPLIRITGIDDSFAGPFTDGVTREVIDVSNSSGDVPWSNASATIFSEVLSVGPTDLSSGVDLNVDGGNDSYLIADDGGLLFGGLTQLTVESQFSIDSVNSVNTILSYETASRANAFFYGVLSDGTVQAFIGGDRVDSALTYPDLLDGNRHSIAVTWDSKNGDTRLYADGDLVHVATGVATGYVYDTGGSLVLGQEQDGVNSGFDPDQMLQGAVYDVRLWSEARSEAEIGQTYQSKIDSVSLPIPLMANWQMDGFDGSGAVIDVVSGNNLTVSHATDPGFTPSTPTSEFRIDENAAVNTVVGTLVPSVQSTTEDVVDDGTFNYVGATGRTSYGAGSTIGGAGGHWQVDSGSVDIVSTWQDSPLGGKPVDLDGNAPGTISQSLTTEPGKTYQLTFALSGNFTQPTAKSLRISVAAETSDFIVEPVDGWSSSNLLWAERSMTFVATSTTTDLKIESLSNSGATGPIISDVQVVELPHGVAALLATDPSLTYDAATNKFYLPVTVGADWYEAQADARTELLNQVPGQLVTIGSAYENDVVHSIAQTVGTNLLIGASDQTTEGDWYWQDGDSDGTQFWAGTGSGTAQNGAYTNWNSTEPNENGSEDHAVFLVATGDWNDEKSHVNLAYIVEWDADAVLSQMAYTLQTDPSGAFAIDSDSGEITVLNGAGLDRESASYHDIVVRVTDATGSAYDETFRIEVDDVPAPLISNLELSALDYLENAGAVNITDTLVISTETPYPADTAEIRIAGGFVSRQDLLAFTDDATFTGNWDNTSATLTITGNGTDANWQDALRRVTYENTSDDPVAGNRNITFDVSYQTEVATSASRLITVSAINDAPYSGDSTVTVTEDTSYTLLTSDFRFFDTIDNDAFNAVQVIIAPVQGQLLLNGNAVVDSQNIPVSQVAAGNLVFHPEPNASGSDYDSLTYQVQDDGGVVNGGDDVSDSIATLTFDVTEVPDPPQLMTNAISLLRGGSFVMSSAHIEAIDGDVPDEQRIITLTADPSFGVIEVGGTTIAANGTMTYADILAGDVRYIHNGVGTSADTIELALADAGLGASGSASASVAVSINETHPQPADDTANVDEGFTVDIAVLANDIAADEPLEPASVSVFDYPLHGNVAIDAVGQVTYTHDGGESLSDTFTYTVADTGGDVSESATVTITISAINDAPEVVSFDGPESNTNEDTQLELTAATLASQINHSDAEDGMITTFQVTSVLSGSLAIGSDATTATPYISGTNDLIQVSGGVTSNAYWTPDTDANSVLPAFTVRGVDSAGASSVAEVDVHVQVMPVNDLPVLAGYGNSLLAAIEDTVLPITITDLQASSSDVEDATIAAIQVQGVLSGSLSIGVNAAAATPFVAGSHDTIDAVNHGYWTADNNAHGTINAFSIRGVDTDGGLSPTSEIVIASVGAVNDTPVLAGYNAVISNANEDTTVTLLLSDLQAGSSDIEDGALDSLVVQTVVSGTLTIGSDQTSATPFVVGANDTINSLNNAYWTPALNSNGDTDAFVVRGVDSAGDMSASNATIILAITPLNDLPVLAGYDNAIVYAIEDTSLTIPLADIQAISSDVEDGALHGMVVQSVASGTLNIGSDQASATPFVVTANDTIDGLNNAYWTPDADANGNRDAFVVRGIDSAGGLSIDNATIKASVAAVNDAPVLLGYGGILANTSEDTTVPLSLIDLQAASGDIEDGDVQGFVVQQVTSGTLRIGADQVSAVPYAAGTNDNINSTQKAYWTPDQDFNGTVGAFTVRGVDSNGELSVSTGSVFIDVAAVNDSPVLSGYETSIVSTTEDTAVALPLADLQGTSSDVEDGPLMSLVVQNVAAGTLLIGADQLSANAFVTGVNDTIDSANLAYWTPDSDVNGATNAFDISAVDSGGQQSVDSATVIVDVSAVNDAPVIAGYDDALVSTNEDTTVEMTLAALQASSRDVEDGLLHGIVVQGVTTGALSIGSDQASATPFLAGNNDTINGSNNAYWTPDLNVNGEVGAFTFRGIDTADVYSADTADVWVSVVAMNDPPMLAGYESEVIATNEDTIATVTLADLQASSTDPEDGELSRIVVQSVSSGVLTIGDSQATATPFTQNTNDIIDDTKNAYWQPGLNQNGSLDAFLFSGQDSDGSLSPTTSVAKGLVDAVNDPPTLSPDTNAAVMMLEDETVAIDLNALVSLLSAEDVDDTVTAMIIEQVDSGSLRIGADIDSALVFAAGSVDTIDSLNKAFWTPEAHVYGDGLSAFKVHAQDSTNAVSAGAEQVRMDVHAVNDAPMAGSSSVSMPSENYYSFKLADFGYGDPVEGDQLFAVRITGLPDIGQLFYQGTPVTLDQEITATAIALGQLQFRPATGFAEDSLTTSIEFAVRDDGGSDNNGIDLSVDAAVLTLIIENEDAPPVASFGSLQIAENNPAGSVIGQIEVTDPDPVTTYIRNGGFAASDRPLNDYNRYSADDSFLGSDLGGWQVMSGSVDIRGDSWVTGPDGGYLVDLNGSEEGAIEQVIETTPGGRYSLTFAYAGHFRNTTVSGGILDFEVSAGNQLTEYTVYEHPEWSQQNLSWQHQTVIFTATENNTTIGFRSLTPGGHGAIITDVVVRDELSVEFINTELPFSITEDGIIQATTSLDHETQSVYDLEVNVIEPDGRTATISVPIEVADINESPQLQVVEKLTATVGAAQTIDSAYLAAIDEDATDQSPDTLTYSLVSLPSNGVLQLNGVELTAAGRFSQQDLDQQRLAYKGITAGPDSFTFRLADGGEDGVSDTEAEFFIDSYDPVQLMAAVSWSMLEAGVITLDATHIDFSGGYTDAGQLRVDVISRPTSAEFFNTQSGLVVHQFTMKQVYDGIITLSHDGREPEAGMIQLELYRIDTEQPTLMDADTVTLDVADIADAPAAIDSVMATDHLTAVTITPGQLGFTDNDDGDDLQGISIVNVPAIGSLLLVDQPVQVESVIGITALQANELRFVPDPLTSGAITETIAFRVVDNGDVGNGGINESAQINTISITVTSNHSPVGVADSILVDEGGVASSLTSNVESVTDNDTDHDTPGSELVAQIITAPLHGTLQLNADGTFVYRHDGSETVSDSFQYQVSDSESDLADGTGSIVQVDIEIVPRNDTPEAGQADNQLLVTNKPFQISLPEGLFTDVDREDDLTLTATLSNGSVLPDWITFDPQTGVFSGTPDSQSADKVIVIVTATDAEGAAAEASFEITVEPTLAAGSGIEEQEEVFAELPVSPVIEVTSAPVDVEEKLVPEESFVSFVGELNQEVKITGLVESQSIVAYTIKSDEPGLIEFEDKVIKHNQTHLQQREVAVVTSGVVSVNTLDMNILFDAADNYGNDQSRRSLYELDKSRDTLDAIVEQKKLVIGSSATVAASVSLGYLVLLARGGLLLGSVMSSMPAWRFLDPVPVLQNFSEEDDDQDDSLESLVDNENARAEDESPQGFESKTESQPESRDDPDHVPQSPSAKAAESPNQQRGVDEEGG